MSSPERAIDPGRSSAAHSSLSYHRLLSLDVARGLAVIVMIYLFLFAVPFALTQVFITKPVLRRKAEAMVIHDAQTLTRSRQREHDHAAEAGGFADALGVDLGAGI